MSIVLCTASPGINIYIVTTLIMITMQISAATPHNETITQNLNNLCNGIKSINIKCWERAITDVNEQAGSGSSH